MSKGNISQYISKKGKLDDILMKKFAKQILNGLSFLHSKKIIHRDLKGSNILLNEKDEIKLSDFGCSYQMEKSLSQCLHEKLQKGLHGTLLWMAPEVISQKPFGRKADIWSFGATLLEMCTGNPPWHGQIQIDNPIQVVLQIGSGSAQPKIPDDINPMLKQVLIDCLQIDYKKRPTSEKLKSYDFFN